MFNFMLDAYDNVFQKMSSLKMKIRNMHGMCGCAVASEARECSTWYLRVAVPALSTTTL